MPKRKNSSSDKKYDEIEKLSKQLHDMQNRLFGIQSSDSSGSDGDKPEGSSDNEIVEEIRDQEPVIQELQDPLEPEVCLLERTEVNNTEQDFSALGSRPKVEDKEGDAYHEEIAVPSFNGSSHLRYRGLAESALTWLDIDITFKPTSADGLLLYNGHRIDGSGDFICLYMEHGFVVFTYNLGTGSMSVKSQNSVSIGEWHQLRISRTGRLAILSVDNQLPMEVLSPGAFTQLSLPQNLYLGGVPNFGIVSSHIKAKTSFVGCIQQVQINGKPVTILAEALGGANVDNCPHPCVARPCGEDGICVPEMEYFSCKCKPGYRDHLCSRGPPYFHGTNSYLHLNDITTMDAVSTNPFVVNVRFKISSKSGLLLCAFGGDNYLSLGLENGALVLRFSVREWEEEIKVVHNSTTVNDRLWHRVKAVRSGSAGLLIVDNGPAITRQSVEVSKKRIFNYKEEGLYIGGMPQTALETLTKYTTSVIGCVADLVINTDLHLQLITHSEIGHNVSECEA